MLFMVCLRNVDLKNGTEDQNSAIDGSPRAFKASDSRDGTHPWKERFHTKETLHV